MRKKCLILYKFWFWYTSSLPRFTIYLIFIKFILFLTSFNCFFLKLETWIVEPLFFNHSLNLKNSIWWNPIFFINNNESKMKHYIGLVVAYLTIMKFWHSWSLTSSKWKSFLINIVSNSLENSSYHNSSKRTSKFDQIYKKWGTFLL